MSFYLVLVGTVDNPIYETTLLSTRAPPSAAAAQASLSSPSQQSFSIFGSPSAPPSASGKSAVSYGPKHGRHVMQLVAHASLDVVEDVQWVNGYMCVCLHCLTAICLIAGAFAQVFKIDRQVSRMDSLSMGHARWYALFCICKLCELMAL